MMPAFPINQESIEEELLRQPGRRLFAPIRNWRPGWEVAYLQGRTQRANEAIAAGNPFPRSLSIGATRVWAGGEVLTASNKNTFESDVMDDLRQGGMGGPSLKTPCGFSQAPFTTAARNALTAGLMALRL